MKRKTDFISHITGLILGHTLCSNVSPKIGTVTAVNSGCDRWQKMISPSISSFLRMSQVSRGNVSHERGCWTKTFHPRLVRKHDCFSLGTMKKDWGVHIKSLLLLLKFKALAKRDLVWFQSREPLLQFYASSPPLTFKLGLFSVHCSTQSRKNMPGDHVNGLAWGMPPVFCVLRIIKNILQSHNEHSLFS